MRSQEYLKMKLFEFGFRESGGKCGLYGEIVCWCLANRVRRNMGSWVEVFQNVPKYRANEPEPTPEFPNLWEPQTQKLLQSVDDIFENAGLDHSNGGLFYCFTSRGSNDWFREFVIGGKGYSVTAIQNELKVWGEATVIGKSYDPRMAGQGWGGTR